MTHWLHPDAEAELGDAAAFYATHADVLRELHEAAAVPDNRTARRRGAENAPRTDVEGRHSR